MEQTIPVPPRLPTPRTLITRLTHREIQVTALLAAGYTQKEVADKLEISFRTVTTHRHHIGTKTGLQLNTDLTRLAIGAGLLIEEVS